MKLAPRDLKFWLNVAACALALVLCIIYAVYSVGNKTFVPSVLVMLIVGIACGAASIFVEFPLLPLAPCAFWSLAFGLFFQNRLMMFGDYINGLPGLSGGGNIIELVFTILIGIALCIAAEIAVCFMNPKKA